MCMTMNVTVKMLDVKCISCQEALRRAHTDPAKLIEDVSNGTPDHQLLNSVAVLPSRRFTKLSHSSLSTTFIRYIIDGYAPINVRPRKSFEQAAPLWSAPLKGLSNILATFPEMTPSKKDWVVIKEIREAYPRITKIIWKDLHLLLPPGKAADSLRSEALVFLNNVMHTGGYTQFVLFNYSLIYYTHDVVIEKT